MKGILIPLAVLILTTLACGRTAPTMEPTAAPTDTPRPTTTAAPKPAPTLPPPSVPAPAPTIAPPLATPAQEGSCDPAYPDVCIPSPPPDLDCKQIPDRNFRVLPPDPHSFDRDQNGVGCEE